MKLTRKCHGCHEDINKDDMIQYSSPTGKTSYWFCKQCYEERISRERFQDKVCEIFGIKSPGPRIWTERKRLMDAYGYTDDAIVDCLEYIYNVEHKNKLAESLVLVGPRSMTNMKQWRAFKKAQASSIAAAMATMETTEYVVPVQEHKKTKKEINLDDALLE